MRTRVCTGPCGERLPIHRFKRFPSGWLSVKCLRCMDGDAQRTRPSIEIVPTREFPGVDIDAIHFKLGAVRKRS